MPWNAFSYAQWSRLSTRCAHLAPQERIRNAQCSSIVDAAVPARAEPGRGRRNSHGRAQLPYFAALRTFRRVTASMALHQLVWAVGAGWRSEVRPRGGVFYGLCPQGHGPN